MPNRLIILGASLFAEIAYEYFTHDSSFEVIAFGVEKKYIKETCLFGLPVHPIEELTQIYSPDAHQFFAAFAYTQLNKLRTRIYLQTKQAGYGPVSYTSSHAFVWRNCNIGEHCFIFENNVIQPFVKIGSNVILWSGNHIGHHGAIKDNCFISSHVVIAGNCEIGDSCFIGVNTTIAGGLKIGSGCVIGAGSLILADVPDDTKVVGKWTKKSLEEKFRK